MLTCNYFLASSVVFKVLCKTLLLLFCLCVMRLCSLACSDEKLLVSVKNCFVRNLALR